MGGETNGGAGDGAVLELREMLATAYDVGRIREVETIQPEQVGIEVAEVQNYLKRFGYLRGRGGFEEGRADEATTEAIRRFQRFAGRADTGVVGAREVELMTLPRCGMLDASPLRFQTVGGWARDEIRYAFGSPTAQQVGAAEAEGQVRLAIDTWRQTGIDLVITEVSQGDSPDVLIEWLQEIDLSNPLTGSAHAHADFPPPFSQHTDELPLPMRFDDAETTWAIGGDIDIQTVALHEFGHILGLGHEGGNRSVVMWPFYVEERRSLHADDVAGVLQLYNNA